MYKHTRKPHQSLKNAYCRKQKRARNAFEKRTTRFRYALCMHTYKCVEKHACIPLARYLRHCPTCSVRVCVYAQVQRNEGAYRHVGDDCYCDGIECTRLFCFFGTDIGGARDVRQERGRPRNKGQNARENTTRIMVEGLGLWAARHIHVHQRAHCCTKTQPKHPPCGLLCRQIETKGTNTKFRANPKW